MKGRPFALILIIRPRDRAALGAKGNGMGRSAAVVARTRRDGSSRWAGLLLLPGAAWLVIFAVLPLGFTFVMSFWTSTIFGTTATWTFDNYLKFVDEPVYVSVLLTTIRIAIVTTVLSLLISYPIAWFLATRRGTARTIIVIAVFMPFWTSYVIRTFLWLPILGRNGVINHLLLWLGVIDQPLTDLVYNESTIYLGLVYVYTLFMVLPIYLALDRLDPRLIEAAADLGATPFHIFRRIILPLSLPGVLSGSIMVFLLSCGAFVTPSLLGGPSASMFGNLISSQFSHSNNWAFGAALSIILIAVVLTFLLIVGRKIGLQRVFVGGEY